MIIMIFPAPLIHPTLLASISFLCLRVMTVVWRLYIRPFFFSILVVHPAPCHRWNHHFSNVPPTHRPSCCCFFLTVSWLWDCCWRERKKSIASREREMEDGFFLFGEGERDDGQDTQSANSARSARGTSFVFFRLPRATRPRPSLSDIIQSRFPAYHTHMPGLL